MRITRSELRWLGVHLVLLLGIAAAVLAFGAVWFGDDIAIRAATPLGR